MTETPKDLSIEPQISLGAVKDIALEIRMRVITRLSSGDGTIEDVIGELVGAVGKKVNFAQSEADGLATENTEDDPRLSTFKTQFESLPSKARKNLSWAQVMKGIQSVDELLTNTSKLENAQVFKVDRKNQLVFCDGGDQVPDSTLRRNYFDNRRSAKAQGLELFSEAEYEELQTQGERIYDKDGLTWLESGSKPSFALSGCWRNGKVRVDDINKPEKPNIYRGARRLLRIKLYL